MADDPIKSALLSLTAKTTTGQLREMLPLIEEKLAAGVKHEEILEVLNAHGLNLTLGSYKTMLYRIRQRAQTPSATSAASMPASTSQPEKATKLTKAATVLEAPPVLPAEVETIASSGVNPTQVLIEAEMPAYSFKQMQEKSKG